MSKDVTARSAMKLALEALNAATRYGAGGFEDAKDALREELAKPDFWEGYVPEPDNTCSNALRAQGKAYPRTCKKCGLGPCVGLAQQALDKKAENARELGLDYEPAQQEPVALFKWLPEGATHIGRISVRTTAGGSLAMTTHAFKYEEAVLKVYITDNDNEYPGWRDAKDCFFHLNFPVLPLYTTPPAQRKPLTDEQMLAIVHYSQLDNARAIEAKLRSKNEDRN